MTSGKEEKKKGNEGGVKRRKEREKFDGNMNSRRRIIGQLNLTWY